MIDTAVSYVASIGCAAEYEEWGEDPDDMDRFENRHLFEPAISEWIAERTTQEVMRILEEARVPYGQVNNIAEMIEDPQVKARELLVNVEYPGVGEVPLPGIIPKFSSL